MSAEPLPFTLEWLTESLGKKPQLSVCPDGHLIVRDRSCWLPRWFSPDGRALFCEPVEHDDKAVTP